MFNVGLKILVFACFLWLFVVFVKMLLVILLKIPKDRIFLSKFLMGTFCEIAFTVITLVLCVYFKNIEILNYYSRSVAMIIFFVIQYLVSVAANAIVFKKLKIKEFVLMVLTSSTIYPILLFMIFKFYYSIFSNVHID